MRNQRIRRQRDPNDIHILEEEDWIRSGGMRTESAGVLNKTLRDNFKVKVGLSDLRSVTQDQKFLDTITLARKELGIEKKYYSDPSFPVREWLLSSMVGIDPKDYAYPSAYDPNEYKLTNLIVKIAGEMNLPPSWYLYIEEFIAVDGPPKETRPVRSLKVKVLNTSDESIVVELRRGVKSQEYKKAWTILSSYLKNPKSHKLYAESLNNKIILDSQEGMSTIEISKKYFPEEYQDDPIAVRDRVYKITTRSKQKES